MLWVVKNFAMYIRRHYITENKYLTIYKNMVHLFAYRWHHSFQYSFEKNKQCSLLTSASSFSTIKKKLRSELPK